MNFRFFVRGIEDRVIYTDVHEIAAGLFISYIYPNVHSAVEFLTSSLPLVGIVSLQAP